MKQKDITKMVGVSISTISRELRRNCGVRGKYNRETAHANAMRKRRKKPGNHRVGESLMQQARVLLATEQWSPEQISGALGKEGESISHVTIYRMIRMDKAAGGELYKHCRHKLKYRRRPVGGGLSSIPNRTPIRERPKEADGKRFGDFEMDTIAGKDNHGTILTITERSNDMLFMRKLPKVNMEIPIFTNQFFPPN